MREDDFIFPKFVFEKVRMLLKKREEDDMEISMTRQKASSERVNLNLANKRSE